MKIRSTFMMKWKKKAQNSSCKPDPLPQSNNEVLNAVFKMTFNSYVIYITRLRLLYAVSASAGFLSFWVSKFSSCQCGWVNGSVLSSLFDISSSGETQGSGQCHIRFLPLRSTVLEVAPPSIISPPPPYFLLKYAAEVYNLSPPWP